MNFLDSGMVIAAFFVGLCLAGGIAIAAYYFLSMRERKSFHRNMEKSTDFVLAKLGLEIANVEHNAEQAKIQTMIAAQAKEAERQRAMANFRNVEYERDQALDAELIAEQKREQVLQQKAANTTQEINIRQSLLNAGIDPNYMPPQKKGRWERHQFMIVFILGLVFIVIMILLHQKGII